MTDRVKKLLSEMTIEEKVGQLTQCGNSIYSSECSVEWDDLKKGKISSFLGITEPERINKVQKIAVEETRLGIPILFAQDVIHGFRTTFPVPWAESMSWEPELAKKTASIAAKEASYTGIKWVFAPMVDISRNPNWGRGCEGAGEDTYLGTEFAKARVEGFQGDDISQKGNVAACAKHFAGYGMVEGGRDYNTVDMSPAKLYNDILPPFKACVDAGVETVMTAFNDLNGEPCTGSKWLIDGILRKEFGFKKVVVSDAGSTEQIATHGYCENDSETAYIALNSGLDMEMMSLVYRENIESLIADGKLTESQLDTAVERVLSFKERLGLFDNPYVDVDLVDSNIMTDEHKKLALECARRSIVLLENKNNVLPLDKNKKIAVIGPMANDGAQMLGEWNCCGKGDECSTAFDAISKMSDATYSKGCGFDIDESRFDSAVKVAEKSDVIVVMVGQPVEMGGEGRSRTEISLPGVQEKLINKLSELKKPMVVIVVSGRPLVLTNIKEKADALIFSGGLGTMAGEAYADVLFGNYNPSAKLTTTFPYTSGQGCSTYYNHNNTGKPPVEEFWWTSKWYDAPIGCLYPFGYGLSYTNYKYSNLLIEDKNIGKDGVLKVSVDVENTGDVAGEEIVQLYIRDVAASMIRPVKQLKAFDKKLILPGQTVKFSFEIPAKNLGFYNQKLEYVVENGKFVVSVGTNSENCLDDIFYIV